MGWQTESVVQLIAGNTIINAKGTFTYSSAPAAGNLIASQAPTAGTDSFGNNYIQGIASYLGTDAAAVTAGAIAFFTGSLAGGWTQHNVIFASASELFVGSGTSVGVELNSGGTTLTGLGVNPIPQSSAGITTVNQLVVALINVGILN